MKKNTIVIIFDTCITSCENWETLMWWQNWVNTKIFWKILQYIQNPNSICPYTSTSDVQIRIACSMAEKLKIPKDELSDLLNNLSRKYMENVRMLNKAMQKELPFQS